MKKLLATAAVCGLVVAAAPAHAEIDLDLGGYMKGYGVYSDTDEDSAVAGEDRTFDIIRNTELHLTGETTLDNGLTVGFHAETEADGNYTDGLEVQESYAYFSSGWGRVNFGAEDGAAYLLQVAAPSADANIDGIRQYVTPVNYNVVQAAGAAGSLTTAASGLILGPAGADGVDYDQDTTGYADKITYLSPVFSGFQVGASYTPDIADASTESSLDLNDVASATGTQGDAYDVAVRYEGTFDAVGFAIGGGYTHVELEASPTAPVAAGDFTDDQSVWNVGLDLDIGAFGVGVVYMEDDQGEVATGATTTQSDEETLVVGVDYTTGPFKLGASYLDQEGTNGIVGATGNDGVETQRWTGGVVYTYGPGMTFRGSVSHIEHDNVPGLTTGNSVEDTSVLVGTQIDF